MFSSGVLNPRTIKCIVLSHKVSTPGPAIHFRANNVLIHNSIFFICGRYYFKRTHINIHVIRICEFGAQSNNVRGASLVWNCLASGIDVKQFFLAGLPLGWAIQSGANTWRKRTIINTPDSPGCRCFATPKDNRSGSQCRRISGSVSNSIRLR